MIYAIYFIGLLAWEITMLIIMLTPSIRNKKLPKHIRTPFDLMVVLFILLLMGIIWPLILCIFMIMFIFDYQENNR